MYGRKELLKPREALFPFDLDQGIFMAFPRSMPAPGYEGSICGDIFLFYQTKARRLDKLFVDADRHKQEKTD